MEIQEISKDHLGQIASLLEKTFPEAGLSVEYLHWLYFENPLGEVVGYNAFLSKEIISHYACIPIRVGEFIGLLSVNTATHPAHRSKGLYRMLAELTFEKHQNNFTFVIGVANASSAPLFVKYLGFHELGRLNLRFGRIKPPEGITRSWDSSTLKWRLASPKSTYKISKHANGFQKVSTRVGVLSLNLQTLIATRESTISTRAIKRIIPPIGVTIDWNRNFKPKLKLPEKLKPSPLVLIIKFLGENLFDLDSWCFLDFDAF